MAQITINEISRNYSYNIGSSSFATVALPITASWGPGYFDGEDVDTAAWSRFPATQAGLEAFVAAYRGPTSGYRLVKDYSYQMAMTLLTSGYDVLVCRLSEGERSHYEFSLVSAILDSDGNPVQDSTSHDIQTNTGASLTVKAKYPGSFGNNISVALSFIKTGAKVVGEGTDQRTAYDGYWNLIVSAKDSNGYITPVENLIFHLDPTVDNESVPYIDEVTSNFVTFIYVPGDVPSGVDGSIGGDIGGGIVVDGESVDSATGTLVDGYDFISSIASADLSTEATNIINWVKTDWDGGTEQEDGSHTALVKAYIYGGAGSTVFISSSALAQLRHKQWLYHNCLGVYEQLTDKLSYNPNRVISPGWDDQNFEEFGAVLGDITVSGNVMSVKVPGPDSAIVVTYPVQVSPLAKKLLHVGYYSRCATAYLDSPYAYPSKVIYNNDVQALGYAQQVSAIIEAGDIQYATHSELAAPWRQFTYVGMSRPVMASPSCLQLLIERAQSLNDPIQYEWALPKGRTHTLNVGKAQYPITQTMLETWQKISGVGVNLLAEIPDLGVTIWGNSTLYNVPVATYQALSNLSTRKLFNAVKDIVYRCGIAITFQYNNNAAYSSFYAGVTPLLDTMRNVGAIEDYRVEMAADINGLDQVNANSIIGKIYLVVNGVINDITVDLIAMPAGTNLNQFIQ